MGRWKLCSQEETKGIATLEGGSGSRLHRQARDPEKAVGPSQGGRELGRVWPKDPESGTKPAWDRSFLHCFLLQTGPVTVKDLPPGAAASSNASGC